MYKYMSEEGALRFVGTLRVRFTQPDDQNDPFEFRPFLDVDGTAALAEQRVDEHLTGQYGTAEDALRRMEEIQAGDPNYPKSDVSIQSFREMISKNPALKQRFMEVVKESQAAAIKAYHSQIVEHMRARWEEFRQTVGKDLGIFCLAEVPTHSPMWAHYGGRHFGVVVEFDERNRWFDQRTTSTDDIRHLKQVVYVANPAPRTWKQITAIDMLYTKGAEWGYEKEWRIIRPLKDCTEVSPGIFCVDVPPEAIRSVIFGCRTSKAVEDEVRAAVAANVNLRHVAYKRAKLGPGGKIEIEDA